MKNDYADFLKMLMGMRRLKMQLKKHIAGMDLNADREYVAICHKFYEELNSAITGCNVRFKEFCRSLCRKKERERTFNIMLECFYGKTPAPQICFKKDEE